MSNMSYCRFENTSRDFSDCVDALEQIEFGNEEPLSRREHAAAIDLLVKATDMLLAVSLATGVEVDDLEEEHFDQYLKNLTVETSLDQHELDLAGGLHE